MEALLILGSALGTLLLVIAGAAIYPFFFKKEPAQPPSRQLPPARPAEVFRVRGSTATRGRAAVVASMREPAHFQPRGGATIRPDAICPVSGRRFSEHDHSRCRPGAN